jgi:5-methyltetrahydrofolate--homocysteine methyltransferase
MTDMLRELSETLQRGDDEGTAALVRRALDASVPVPAILDQGLIAGMSEVGRQFKAREIFLPDVLLAARAMIAGMDLLRPRLAAGQARGLGTVVIGTVQGDLHDIGKNLVAVLLQGAGFQVVDLGHDVAPDRFIDVAIAEKADVIGLSALLTTTMPVMKTVVDRARERGIRDRTRIIVGGAPLSADYAREIGADAYCFDGISAVDCIKRFVGRA